MMNTRSADILADLMVRRPELKACERDILAACTVLRDCFAAGGKLFTCGNGGSAADAEHIVGELMKGFRLPRPLAENKVMALAGILGGQALDFAKGLQAALPAISLNGHPSLATAFANDLSADMVFAQLLCGWGKPGDSLLAISTSGNAQNVFNASIAAKAFGITVIGLTGREGGKLGELSDTCIRAPADETFLVQELHLPIYHALCAMLENEFFGHD